MGRRRRGSIGLFQSNTGKGHFKSTQAAHFQAVIGVGSADGEGHGEGILTGNHMINIRGMAGHVVSAELDVTLCIAGEDVGCLVGLSSLGSKVVFQLDLPPVTGSILGNQRHGSLVIFPSQRLHGCFRPGLVALKAVGGHFGLFNTLNGIVLKHNAAGT